MKFTIDRAKWITGGSGRGERSLLNDEGFMCCLGFLAKACGYQDEDIHGCGAPTTVIDIADTPDLFPEWLTDLDNHDDGEDRFMTVNDNEQFRNDIREEKLQKLFADRGIELTFEGEYAPPSDSP